MATAAATRSKSRLQSAISFSHQFSNYDINLCKTDIIQFNGAECIVNSTGPNFEHASGVARAICASAGINDLSKEFVKYLNQNRVLDFEEVFVTSAFDLKNYKFIFHVASPYERLPKKLEILQNTIFNILSMAFINKNLKSIAMPLIGTGNNRIDTNEFLEAFFSALERFTSIGGSKDRYQINLINNTPSIDVINNQLSSLVVQKRKHQSSSNSEDDNEIKVVKKQDVAASDAKSKDDGDDNNCVICMDKITNEKKLDKCAHKFCFDCIDQYFKSGNKACPICGMAYGINKGTQPPGTMSVQKGRQSVPGYERYGTIVITYVIPNGIQGPEHPHPGVPYHGTSRMAFLPDNKEGNEILELLRIAFDNRLVFTVGQSRTTNADNVVTWNDIHHKTSISGGATSFGYPDPTYLSRVRQELAAKGVVKK